MSLLSHLFKTQKDICDKLQVLSTVLIPIVIGVASYPIQKSIAEQSVRVQKSIAQQSLAKDYVGFAITILERPEQEGNSDLREWATKLLVHHAPSILLPIRPGPGNLVRIYDLQDARQIATFDAGVGYDYPPRFRWSRDSSKLLISFNTPYGKVVAYDLAQSPSEGLTDPRHPSVGKLLGEYRTKAGEKIDSFSFSEDERSVVIKTTDGTTEVWQLP